MAAEAYVVLIYTSLQNIVYMYVRCPSVTEGGPRMLVYTNLEIAVVGGNCINWSLNSFFVVDDRDISNIVSLGLFEYCKCYSASVSYLLIKIIQPK